MDRLVKLLGDKNKVRMLLVLEAEGPMKKTDLYGYVKANNANALKLEELEKEGLVDLDLNTFASNTTMVALTLEGRAIARKLKDIEGILSGEVSARGDDQIDYDTSEEQGDLVN